MKFKIFISLFLLIVFSCSKSEQKEIIIYETNKKELLVLELDREKKEYKINWILSGSQNETNIFGIIEFSDKFSIIKNQNEVFLPSKIISNNVKFSDGRIIKAPVSQDPNIKFDLSNNNIIFYKDSLFPNDKYSPNKCIELIEAFVKWDGGIVNFNSLLKD